MLIRITFSSFAGFMNRARDMIRSGINRARFQRFGALLGELRAARSIYFPAEEIKKYRALLLRNKKTACAV